MLHDRIQIKSGNMITDWPFKSCNEVSKGSAPGHVLYQRAASILSS